MEAIQKKSSSSVFVLSTRTSKQELVILYFSDCCVLWHILCDFGVCLWHLCTVAKQLKCWADFWYGLRFMSDPALDGYFLQRLLILRLSIRRVSILPPYHHRHRLRTLAVSVLWNSINRPICVSVVTTHYPCSSTWVVLDQELWVIVLVLVLWVLDTSLKVTIQNTNRKPCLTYRMVPCLVTRRAVCQR